MADGSKASFLGSISPWSVSRNASPGPKTTKEEIKEVPLQPSSGLDHAISLRPTPSLRRYPKDCPPLKTRWYYAVDIPKRKPFAQFQPTNEAAKSSVAPKKFVTFSASDSQAIESAYQALDRGDNLGDDADDENITDTRVKVNEDYLFDVAIEKRELEPAYWLGPVYEVRRGSWFYQEGSTIRPCDENLANQVEEGYLKTTPWRRASVLPQRSTSQNRGRPSSMIIEASKPASASQSSPKQGPADGESSRSENLGPSSHRLFGAHMNTTVNYQDATTAWLTSDDFMSRMSSTVYGRFGGMAGTKIVRGYPELGKATENKKTVTSEKPEAVKTESGKDTEEPAAAPKRTALERQLSSLAGVSAGNDTANLAEQEEEAREQEQQEMEDAATTNDQGREIEHVVLVTHGIGQRLGLRLDSINFVHDVNTLRKTMKAVYSSSPDLQALSDQPQNCKVQVLPVVWRHLLDFPKQSLRENRKEFDLGDADASFEDDYPSLQDITVDGVPAVRNLITDLAMDVLLYQSAYREHIAGLVQKECNRVYALFKQRNPNFKGRISLCGHSLGSAILFDILCRQKDPNMRYRAPSKSSKDKNSQQDLRLDFECDNFFCFGSPIALFQMLKGRTVAGRSAIGGLDDEPLSPFDPDLMVNEPFRQPSIPANIIPITISSPKCAEFYNIFHPTDPIAYRIEPLISPAMAQLKPQPLPYTKKGLPAGIANVSARIGQSVGSFFGNFTSGVASSLINRSLGITGEEQALPQDSRPRPTTAVGTDAKNPLGSPGPAIAPQTMPVADDKRQREIAEAVRSKSVDHPDDLPPTLIDTEIESLYSGFQKHRSSHQATKSGSSIPEEQLRGMELELEAEKSRRLKREEAKVKALNSNGRVDYSIQEGMFDLSLLASIASHLSYWADEDVNHFMIGQMLKRGRLGK